MLIGGGVVVGLLLGLGLAATGIVPVGGSSVESGIQSVQVAPVTPTALPEMTSLPGETPLVVADTSDEGVIDSISYDSTAVIDSGLAVTPDLALDQNGPDSAATVVSENLPQDSLEPVPVVAPEAEVRDAQDGSGAVEETPAGDAATPQLSGNPVIVEGLEIESVTEVELRGQPGFRVVQLLDSGSHLTIESYPDTLRSFAGRVRVIVTPPDTVVGIWRMRTHLVYASGVMPEDSLRALMDLLVVADSAR